MKTVEVTIKGITPLLQHRFTEKSEQPGVTRPVLDQPRDPRAEAEQYAYRNGSSYYFPGAAIARLLREAGGSHKLKGNRKSIKYIVPAAVIVSSDAITILKNDCKSKVTKFEVDSRPVVIPATKGRIMRHRPRWDAWAAKFILEIDPEVLTVELIHQLLTEGGTRIGIGDYRPERGGPFGRFRVTSWKEKQ